MTEHDSRTRRPHRGPTRAALVALPIAMALVALAAFGAGIAAADDVPGEPIAFHGEATDDDETLAPAGTAIVAAVDGTEVDRITVASAGIYAGDGPTDDKLRTHTEAGETVTFHVGDADGPQAEQVHTIAGDDGLGEPGVFEIDLRFPAGIFEGDPGDGDEAPDDEAPDDEDDPVDDDPVDEDPADDENGDGGDDSASSPGSSPPSAPSSPPDSIPPSGSEPIDEGDEELPVDDPEPPTITDDPDAIRDQIDLPTDVTPTRSERAGLVADEAVGGSTATFSEESSVESVRFGDDVDGDVTVTELDPADGAGAPGTSAATVDIAVPSGSETSPATVRSRVSADRLAAIDADASELRIHRLVDGDWEALETRAVEETSTGAILEAETPGFSLFAVGAVSTPVAAAEIPPEVEIGEEALMDGRPSSDRHGEIVSHRWSIAGEVLTGETVSRTFEEAGTYAIELTVTNDAGESDTVVTDLSVGGGEESDGEPATDGGAGPDEEASGGHLNGWGPIVLLAAAAVLALLVGAILYRRRTVSKRRPPW